MSVCYQAYAQFMCSSVIQSPTLPSLCMLSQPDFPVILKVVFNTTRLSEALSKCFFGHWERFHPFLYHFQSIFVCGVFKPFSLIIKLFEYKNKPKSSDDSIMFIHIRLLKAACHKTHYVLSFSFSLFELMKNANDSTV